MFVRLHRGVVRLPCLRTPHALLLAMSWCLLFGVAVSSLLAAFRSLARKTCCRRNWRRTSLQGVALVVGTTKVLVWATNWTLFLHGDSRTLILWCCRRAVWSHARRRRARGWQGVTAGLFGGRGGCQGGQGRPLAPLIWVVGRCAAGVDWCLAPNVQWQWR